MSERKRLRHTIGVMGSGDGYIPKPVREKSRLVGKTIAQRGYIVATGGCSGVPYEAARGAFQEGGFVLGVSPAFNYHEHISRYKFPTKYYNLLIYSGMGFIERDVLNIRTSDAIIVIAGRSGTLNEFTIAYDEGRDIGVLLDTGGISNMVRDIVAAFNKKTGTTVVYDKDPVALVDKMIKCLKKKKPFWPELR